MLDIVAMWGCWPYIATFGYVLYDHALAQTRFWPVWWFGVAISYLTGMYACLAWFVIFNF